MAHVWIWASPDGPMFFGSRRRAMDYVERCFPGGTWEHDGDEDHLWVYSGARMLDEDGTIVSREAVL